MFRSILDVFGESSTPLVPSFGIMSLGDGTDGGEGGGSPPPAGDAGTPPAGAEGDPPPPPGDAGADGGGEGIRQLRQAYEGLKGDHEPFKNLGADADSLGASHKFFTGVRSEVDSIGKELGYPQDQIEESWKADPVTTLAFLRREKAQKASTQDPSNIQGRVDDAVKKALTPFEEKENLRLTKTANATFDAEYDTILKGDFKDNPLPKETEELFYNMVSEIFKYQEGDVKALKMEGKTAGIKKAYDQGKKMLLEGFTAWSKAERERAAGGTPPPAGGTPPAGGKKRLTLDQIIAGDDAATAAIPSLQRGR